VRDFKTAWQFFSDVYGVAYTLGTSGSFSMSGNSCPRYLRQDEVTIVQQSAGAKLNYLAGTGGCALSTRAAFSWGDWDCGGCSSGTGTKKPKGTGNLSEEQIAEYNNMQQGKTKGACFSTLRGIACGSVCVD